MVYLSANGEVLGQFDEKNLAGLIASGQVPRDSYYWREGMPEWRLLKELALPPQPRVPGAPVVEEAPAPASPPKQVEDISSGESDIPSLGKDTVALTPEPEKPVVSPDPAGPAPAEQPKPQPAEPEPAVVAETSKPAAPAEKRPPVQAKKPLPKADAAAPTPAADVKPEGRFARLLGKFRRGKVSPVAEPMAAPAAKPGLPPKKVSTLPPKKTELLPKDSSSPESVATSPVSPTPKPVLLTKKTPATLPIGPKKLHRPSAMASAEEQSEPSKPAATAVPTAGGAPPSTSSPGESPEEQPDQPRKPDAVRRPPFLGNLPSFKPASTAPSAVESADAPSPASGAPAAKSPSPLEPRPIKAPLGPARPSGGLVLPPKGSMPAVGPTAPLPKRTPVPSPIARPVEPGSALPPAAAKPGGSEHAGQAQPLKPGASPTASPAAKKATTVIPPVMARAAPAPAAKGLSAASPPAPQKDKTPEPAGKAPGGELPAPVKRPAPAPLVQARLHEAGPDAAVEAESPAAPRRGRLIAIVAAGLVLAALLGAGAWWYLNAEPPAFEGEVLRVGDGGGLLPAAGAAVLLVSNEDLLLGWRRQAEEADRKIASLEVLVEDSRAAHREKQLAGELLARQVELAEEYNMPDLSDLEAERDAALAAEASALAATENLVREIRYLQGADVFFQQLPGAVDRVEADPDGGFRMLLPPDTQGLSLLIVAGEAVEHGEPVVAWLMPLNEESVTDAPRQFSPANALTVEEIRRLAGSSP